MYIAVVCRGPAEPNSLRSNNGWASFISASRNGAVDQALEANRRWGGKYTVMVGELQYVARPKRAYTIRRIEA
jgi:hypothetical protein